MKLTRRQLLKGLAVVAVAPIIGIPAIKDEFIHLQGMKGAGFQVGDIVTFKGVHGMDGTEKPFRITSVVGSETVIQPII